MSIKLVGYGTTMPARPPGATVLLFSRAQAARLYISTPAYPGVDLTVEASGVVVPPLIGGAGNFIRNSAPLDGNFGIRARFNAYNLTDYDTSSVVVDADYANASYSSSASEFFMVLTGVDGVHDTHSLVGSHGSSFEVEKTMPGKGYAVAFNAVGYVHGTDDGALFNPRSPSSITRPVGYSTIETRIYFLNLGNDVDASIELTFSDTYYRWINAIWLAPKKIAVPLWALGGI